MGGNPDMTDFETGKKGSVRNRERIVFDIIERLIRNNNGEPIQKIDVFNEAERKDIDTSAAYDIIDTFSRQAKIFYPSNDTIQLM